MLFNLGLFGGLNRARTFGSKAGVDRNTVITSRKCYPLDIAALDTITIVGGEGTLGTVQYSLDGGAWTSEAGVWGTSKYIQVRGTSSSSFLTALSANIEIGSENYLFYVTTTSWMQEYSPDGWYNPANLDTLSQDTAGTVAVTATGQSVRRMADLSGNDNHILFSGTNPPTLQTDSEGSYYLQPVDATSRGVCSSLVVADPLTVIAIIDATKDYTNQIFYDSYEDTAGNYLGLSSTSNKLMSGGQLESLLSDGYQGRSIYTQVHRDTGSKQYVNTILVNSGDVAVTGLNGLSIFDLRGNPDPVAPNYTSDAKLYGLLILNGELSSSSIATLESYMLEYSSIDNEICFILGDSTVAPYLTYNSVIDYIATPYLKYSIAQPSNTIANQRTAWIALPVEAKAKAHCVIVQVGLNDIDGVAGNTAGIIASLQSLVDLIRDDIGTAQIILSTMTPANGLFDDNYQLQWVAVNEAIAGLGATPITDADVRVTAHSTTMADVNGNLLAAYDHGDGIHPNNAGREENANAINVALLFSTPAVNPDDSDMLNPDDSQAYNPA